MKIAILHDLLVKLGWAEKVLEKIMLMYTDAHIYTLIYDEKKVWKVFPKNKITKVYKKTQNIYNLFWNQRFCLPYMQEWVESFDLSSYDIVIALNSAFVHGAITKPETKFIVYYHTPARYMWDRSNEYKKEIWFNKWIKLFLLNKFLKKLRIWDYIASKRHDITLCNSNNVKDRIKKYYNLDATVLYPNVDVNRFFKKIYLDIELPFKKYYIIISALTEFKKVNLAIKEFNKLKDYNLVIIWTWNYEEKLKSIAKENIKFLWPKYDNELVYLLQNAAWLIFPWEEDFGIVPIEANAAWVPVFAYYSWWLKETMIKWVSWDFFYDKSWIDFAKNFLKFDSDIIAWIYNKEKIQANALKYSEDEFERQFKNIILSVKSDLWNI